MNTTTIHTDYFGDITFSAPQRSTVAIAVLAAFVFYYAFNSIKQSRKGKLPPGPPGLPLVGNLFQLSRDAWYSFTDWKEKYGAPSHIAATKACLAHYVLQAMLSTFPSVVRAS